MRTLSVATVAEKEIQSDHSRSEQVTAGSQCEAISIGGGIEMRRIIPSPELYFVRGHQWPSCAWSKLWFDVNGMGSPPDESGLVALLIFRNLPPHGARSSFARLTLRPKHPRR